MKKLSKEQRIKIIKENLSLATDLLSKGYDLPNFLLGYKTLFESELCIYE